MLRENLGIVQQLFQALDAIQDFDQPRVVIVERTQHRGALQFVKFRQFLIGARGPTAVRHVQARQRADAIDAVGKSLGLVVRGLEIAPGLDLFADVVEVLRGVEIVGDHMARGIDDAQLAVVKSEAVIFLDDPHEQRGKVSEDGNLFAETVPSCS